jgi:hypothetical protein
MTTYRIAAPAKRASTNSFSLLLSLLLTKLLPHSCLSRPNNTLGIGVHIPASLQPAGINACAASQRRLSSAPIIGLR